MNTFVNNAHTMDQSPRSVSNRSERSMSSSNSSSLLQSDFRTKAEIIQNNIVPVKMPSTPQTQKTFVLQGGICGMRPTLRQNPLAQFGVQRLRQQMQMKRFSLPRMQSVRHQSTPMTSRPHTETPPPQHKDSPIATPQAMPPPSVAIGQDPVELSSPSDASLAFAAETVELSDLVRENSEAPSLQNEKDDEVSEEEEEEEEYEEEDEEVEEEAEEEEEEELVFEELPVPSTEALWYGDAVRWAGTVAAAEKQALPTGEGARADGTWVACDLKRNSQSSGNFRACAQRTKRVMIWGFLVEFSEATEIPKFAQAFGLGELLVHPNLLHVP